MQKSVARSADLSGMCLMYFQSCDISADSICPIQNGHYILFKLPFHEQMICSLSAVTILPNSNIFVEDIFSCVTAYAVLRNHMRLYIHYYFPWQLGFLTRPCCKFIKMQC